LSQKIDLELEFGLDLELEFELEFELVLGLEFELELELSNPLSLALLSVTWSSGENISVGGPRTTKTSHSQDPR